MVAAILMFVLAGCTRSNYVDSVPANSKAVVSVNAMELIDDDSPVKTVLLPFVNKDKKSLKAISRHLTRCFRCLKTEKST